ncbi:MAG: DUF3276 family protein [Spirochaetes bacterium]|nr:DUF3276 family protein [Spirochaetota bacterium]
MGIRGELFSTRFACEGRTYFFNVKQNRNGDVFLSIVESKPSEGESFDRRSVVVFGESMEGFLKSFQSALKYMDKTGNKVDPDPTASNRYDENERPARSEAPRRRTEGQRSERSSSFREGPRPEGRPTRKYTLKPREGTSREGSSRDSSPRIGAPRESSLKAGAPRYPAPPAEARRQDKPVKRIVVRRVKGKDSEA